MIERKSRLGVVTTGGTEEGAEAGETTGEKPRGWRHERKAWGRSDTAAERSTLQAADLVCVGGGGSRRKMCHASHQLRTPNLPYAKYVEWYVERMRAQLLRQPPIKVTTDARAAKPMPCFLIAHYNPTRFCQLDHFHGPPARLACLCCEMVVPLRYGPQCECWQQTQPPDPTFYSASPVSGDNTAKGPTFHSANPSADWRGICER